MSFARIKGPLTSRINRPVNFGAPQDVRNQGGVNSAGIIIDEVWADESVNEAPPHEGPCDRHCWGDYSFCAQHIEWTDGSRSIRLAYYRRRCGEDFWEFASQMTVNAGWKTTQALLQRTLAKSEWFKEHA